MSKTIIKICGIKNAEIAAISATLGAHFIGIIFHPASKRFVNIECAKQIAKASKENHATPVAIFVNHTAEEMHEICQQTDIQTVQLQGDISRREHHLLPQHYQRLYVQSVLPNGCLQQIENDTLDQCDPARDYVLFDNQKAGSGNIFDWQNFQSNTAYRIGLAGGLTSENVGTAIKIINPYFVDVSSGVENKQGEKDIFLIKKFIHTVFEFNEKQP